MQAAPVVTVGHAIDDVMHGLAHDQAPALWLHGPDWRKSGEGAILAAGLSAVSNLARTGAVRRTGRGVRLTTVRLTVRVGVRDDVGRAVVTRNVVGRGVVVVVAVGRRVIVVIVTTRDVDLVDEECASVVGRTTCA